MPQLLQRFKNFLAIGLLFLDLLQFLARLARCIRCLLFAAAASLDPRSTGHTAARSSVSQVIKQFNLQLCSNHQSTGLRVSRGHRSSPPTDTRHLITCDSLFLRLNKFSFRHISHHQRCRVCGDFREMFRAARLVCAQIEFARALLDRCRSSVLISGRCAPVHCATLSITGLRC